MPQCRVEVPEEISKRLDKPRIVSTKNIYSDHVKTNKWQEKREQKPIDVDPYCPGKVNHFLSHYNQLGNASQVVWSTTTKDMLEQVFVKDSLRPEKLMNNYYSYNDSKYVDRWKSPICPGLCADQFVTTMQHSYKVPRPHVMRRLALPVEPYLKNRRTKHDVPQLSACKFFDDDFQAITRQLQKNKCTQWSSFNPMTCIYSNSGQ